MMITADRRARGAGGIKKSIKQRHFGGPKMYVFCNLEDVLHDVCNNMYKK